MRATGIVRRIDELGRVVIPKEIRRTQRIRQGDALEIFTEADGKVIFRKYSQMAELNELAGVYAEVLAKQLSAPVMVCDRDTVVAVSGGTRGELLGKHITPELEKLLAARGVYTAPRPSRPGKATPRPTRPMRPRPGPCASPRPFWHAGWRNDSQPSCASRFPITLLPHRGKAAGRAADPKVPGPSGTARTAVFLFTVSFAAGGELC